MEPDCLSNPVADQDTRGCSPKWPWLHSVPPDEETQADWFPRLGQSQPTGGGGPWYNLEALERQVGILIAIELRLGALKPHPSPGEVVVVVVAVVVVGVF